MGNLKSKTEEIVKGYGRETTAEEAIGGRDLENQHYFVTGANTGLGKEASRVLFNAGATVTMAGRNEEKLKSAVEFIEKQKPENCKGKLILSLIDLSSQDSIKKAVEAYSMREEGEIEIDSLINNAGVMAVQERKVTPDGFELQIGVNHFGHFTLTMLLLPHIKEGGRIVCLSSRSHNHPYDNFPEDYNCEKAYSPFKAYGNSKLSNLLFAKELNRRLKTSKKKITCYSVHPGVIMTDLGRHMGWMNYAMAPLYPVFKLAKFFKTIPQGAATEVFCAVSDEIGEEHAGKYFQDCGLGPVSEKGQNDELAVKFFDFSEEKTGLKYPYESKDGDRVEEEKKGEQTNLEVEIEEKKEEETTEKKEENVTESAESEGEEGVVVEEKKEENPVNPEAEDDEN